MGDLTYNLHSVSLLKLYCTRADSNGDTKYISNIVTIPVFVRSNAE